MRRLYQDTNSKKLIIIWVMVVVLIVALGVGGFFLSSTYFYKDQPSKGYVEFAPGIYLEFNEETVLIDENNPQNWKLLYYANINFEKDPVEFNTKNEPAGPGKVYFVKSPAFRSGQNENGEAAPFVARAKLEYLDQNGNPISDEVLNQLFSQDFTDVEIASNYAGQMLEFEDGWVLGNKGYYYYLGDNTYFEEPTVFDLEAIKYSKYAPYIKVFKAPGKEDTAPFRLANITIENYGVFGITEIKIVLKMEFAEHLSSISRDWFNK